MSRSSSTHYQKFSVKLLNLLKNHSMAENLKILRGKSKTPPKSSFVIGCERINCRRIIANKFNEYFVSLASNINASTDPQGGVLINNVPPFCQYLINKVDTSIYLYDTYDLEIVDIIKDFEIGKASDIPTILIKKSAKLISPLLAKLYNNCTDAGIFPQIFKTGKITKIFKKGNKELLENYRPVSVLPIFGKIFEKILYDRLYNFFTKENVLSINQYGFRKIHSTVHSSVRMIELARQNKLHTVAIFIDLSKAFDTLDHSIKAGSNIQISMVKIQKSFQSFLEFLRDPY